ncbi:hypothetical protein M5689_002640 [Euphorbia peplus]|nr:hypothetical protein M5689_002640 [Euphorbia peplus]
MNSNDPNLPAMIDPNPSIMKVIRSFTAEDYTCCALLTAFVARVGYGIGIVATSETGDCKTEGVLMGGIIYRAICWTRSIL